NVHLRTEMEVSISGNTTATPPYRNDKAAPEWERPCRLSGLLDDLGDSTGADGAATLADRETQTLFHGHRLDQLDVHLGVVTRHDHLGALRQAHHTGHVGGAEVELRTVVVEERRVTAALLLVQDVGLTHELRVRSRGARLDHDLTALDVL